MTQENETETAERRRIRALALAAVQGATVVAPGTPVRFTREGGQHFGSGGYSAGSTLYGEVAVTDARCKRGSFVSDDPATATGQDGAVLRTFWSDAVSDGRGGDTTTVWSVLPLLEREDVQAELVRLRTDAAAKAAVLAAAAAYAQEEAEHRLRHLDPERGQWNCGAGACGPDSVEDRLRGDALVLWASLPEHVRQALAAGTTQGLARRQLHETERDLAVAKANQVAEEAARGPRLERLRGQLTTEVRYAEACWDGRLPALAAKAESEAATLRRIIEDLSAQRRRVDYAVDDLSSRLRQLQEVLDVLG